MDEFFKATMFVPAMMRDYTGRLGLNRPLPLEGRNGTRSVADLHVHASGKLRLQPGVGSEQKRRRGPQKLNPATNSGFLFLWLWRNRAGMIHLAMPKNPASWYALSWPSW